MRGTRTRSRRWCCCYPPKASHHHLVLQSDTASKKGRRRRLPVFARFFLPLLLLLPLFLAHDDRSERAGCCVKWWFFFILLCAVLFYIPWCSSMSSRPSPAKFFCMHEEKFSPFQWTGRWKFATNGGSSQHFYRRLNALKTARIESREDSKTLTVAEIGKNGYCFVKRARCNPRFSH